MERHTILFGQHVRIFGSIDRVNEIVNRFYVRNEGLYSPGETCIVGAFLGKGEI
jgi:hypothetical protein